MDVCQRYARRPFSCCFQCPANAGFGVFRGTLPRNAKFTPISVALATAPRNVRSFAHLIRDPLNHTCSLLSGGSILQTSSAEGSDNTTLAGAERIEKRKALQIPRSGSESNTARSFSFNLETMGSNPAGSRKREVGACADARPRKPVALRRGSAA